MDVDDGDGGDGVLVMGDGALILVACCLLLAACCLLLAACCLSTCCLGLLSVIVIVICEQNFGVYEFLFSAAGIPEQKEEKASKRSQPVAMFPCFSLPAVCARAIQKVELGIWIQCYGKFSCETHFAVFRVFRKPW